jgi:hypothetical protein
MTKYFTEYGLPGAAILTVEGVPDPQVGVNGDQARSTNGTTYVKTAGMWSVQNGSSVQTNWAVLQLTPPAPLTVGAGNSAKMQEADIAIASQSGSDFSVGTDALTESGCILSVAGGTFQFAFYVGTPSDATLDGSSAVQRWLQAFASPGPTDNADPNYPIGAGGAAGLDDLVPVLVTESPAFVAALTHASTPAYVRPGKLVLCNIGATLIGGVGSDSIPLDNVLGTAYIWQIGPPPSN